MTFHVTKLSGYRKITWHLGGKIPKGIIITIIGQSQLQSDYQPIIAKIHFRAQTEGTKIAESQSRKLQGLVQSKTTDQPVVKKTVVNLISRILTPIEATAWKTALDSP